MNRRDFLKRTGLVTGALIAGRTASAAPSARPNFVWIVSEDNSVHYLKLFGPTGASAPNIEKLAENGVVFNHAFSNAPVCSVARTTLMSSTYAPRGGYQYHRKIKLATLPDGLRLFPAYLRDAGYYTTNKSKKDYNVVEGKGVWDQSSRKASWRKRPSKDTPFFHMESTAVSHESRLHFKSGDFENKNVTTDPRSVAVAPYHPDTPLFRFTYARYHDCMSRVDREVDRIVSALEEDGLLEDTFIFYFGDHGGVLPCSKGYIHESGLHVPLVVRIPEKWKHLVSAQRGTRSDGFVSFIDFGPTLLHLAGVEVPNQADGKPFLGPDISVEALNARDETFGYADRFDEKYDFCRSLRKGRYKYLRNYEAFYPDGLQNNYRYKQLAYSEWRRLYKQGKLNAVQRRFFEPKPGEALYDVAPDPHETPNLAAHAKTLADMRSRLRAHAKGLPDLSFYPESHLVAHALDNGAAFGQKHKAEIARLVDVADLSLLPFDKARPGLEKALASGNRWERYWALIVCGCFADKAKPLVAAARQKLEDDALLVRVRAAEFLATVGAEDPCPTLIDVLNTTTSAVEALITLNSVVYVRDHLGCSFDHAKLKLKVKDGQVKRRLDYLAKTM